MYCIMVNFFKLDSDTIDYFKDKICKVYSTRFEEYIIAGQIKSSPYLKDRFVFFDTLEQAENYLYLQ